MSTQIKTKVHANAKNVQKSGKIITITGSMFSGKTTEMLKLSKQISDETKTKSKILKWLNDIRENEDNTHLSIHNNSEKVKCFRINNILDPNDLSVILGIGVLCIDDGQFFEGIVKFSNVCASEPNNITVIIAALDTDFRRKQFPEIADLMAHSDEVIKLKAICHDCGLKEAIYTHKIGGSEEIIEIGGKEKYVPLCRNCFSKK